MIKSIVILLVMMSVNKSLKAQQQAIQTTTTFPNNSNPVSVNPIPYGDPGTEKDYDFYMKRSKNYRTVGWSTLIGAVVLSGVGLLISASNSASFNQVETGVVIMGYRCTFWYCKHTFYDLGQC